MIWKQPLVAAALDCNNVVCAARLMLCCHFGSSASAQTAPHAECLQSFIHLQSIVECNERACAVCTVLVYVRLRPEQLVLCIMITVLHSVLLCYINYKKSLHDQKAR